MTVFERLITVSAALALVAAAPVPDPDWPCVQRLVPTLTAGGLWPGLDTALDWHSDPRIEAIVADIAPRNRPTDESLAKLNAFVATRPSGEALAEMFTGLVEQTNLQRTQVIERLRGIGHRQRKLAETTAAASAELRALDGGASEEKRQEIVDRRTLLIREYEAIDRTIRYACEVPVELEARLGRFAQVLRRGMPN
jgi:hypothetical protein